MGVVRPSVSSLSASLYITGSDQTYEVFYISKKVWDSANFSFFGSFLDQPTCMSGRSSQISFCPSSVCMCVCMCVCVCASTIFQKPTPSTVLVRSLSNCTRSCPTWCFIGVVLFFAIRQIIDFWRIFDWFLKMVLHIVKSQFFKTVLFLYSLNAITFKLHEKFPQLVFLMGCIVRLFVRTFFCPSVCSAGLKKCTFSLTDLCSYICYDPKRVFESKMSSTAQSFFFDLQISGWSQCPWTFLFSWFAKLSIFGEFFIDF